ncbi:hypothetical protein GJAV_G00072380 [Gymnothorax javanicus]|nr:hypothetical protein GJAV_G00072380 [Gymnothorax javanicus]
MRSVLLYYADMANDRRMTARERRRIYQRLILMFILAVVTLTMVERGNLGIGPPFQEEKREHPEQGEPESKGVTQKKRLPMPAVKFWKPGLLKLELTTESPGMAEDQANLTWDITSVNCSSNLNLSSTEGFAQLEPIFQQFLQYRQCRYFPMIMNHPEKCQGKVYLLVVIKSMITQHDRREVIRRTWGMEQEIDGKKIKTLFLLGTSTNQAEKNNHQKLLEYENRIYGDILQWDFMDSFFNLTLKEVSFLKWFSTYCGQVQYIFKGDDDVFVNIQNIFEFLGDIFMKNLIAGDVLFKAKPIRKTDNKYYIPRALYNKTFYPPYVGGGGFLMDGPVARKLYRACESVDLFPIDDVFLGMCLQVLEVSPLHHGAFKTFGLIKNKKSKLNKEPCFFREVIVVHKLLPPDLLHMWELVNSDLNCTKKFTIL